jgi:alkyl hydroperoxide reductase subunit AhpC
MRRNPTFSAPKHGSAAGRPPAETTERSFRFHDWLGDSWGVLFSHPIKPEFDRRNVKVLALSVESLDSHRGWTTLKPYLRVVPQPS